MGLKEKFENGEIKVISDLDRQPVTNREINRCVVVFILILIAVIVWLSHKNSVLEKECYEYKSWYESEKEEFESYKEDYNANTELNQYELGYEQGLLDAQ